MKLNKKNESDPIRFLADRQLFVMGICYWICMIAACIVGATIGFQSNEIAVLIFFLLMTLAVNVISLCALPKWRIIIELDNESISYKPTFKKKVIKKYSDFGYFYCASYTYYTQKKYIVFSQRRLSDYELTHINNVPVSDKLIKIKVRKGLKEVLSPMLPPKYLFRIPKDFW